MIKFIFNKTKMSKLYKIYFLLIINLIFVNCQMIFPGDQDYMRASFIGHADNVNSPIDEGYSEGLIGTNLIPSYNNYNNNANKYNTLSSGLNNFALNINKVLLQQTANHENIVLSPFSITGALALLLLGSVGQTYSELAEALGFFHDIGTSQSVHREFGKYIEKLTRKDLNEYNAFRPNISYASALFLQQQFPIRQQYEDFIKNVYKSVVRHVDFKNRPGDARSFINSWVSEMTKGKIENILQVNPPTTTRIILASALHFKAEWEKYFQPGLTAKSSFYLDKTNPKNIVKVDMMGNVAELPYYKNDELMIIGLPYKGNNTFLYAIKPVDATRKNIKEIINEMTSDSLDELIRNAKYQSTIVTFPKMKLSTNYNLRKPLEAMGVRSIFSSYKSNLALLSPAQNLAPSLAQNLHENVYDSNDDDNDFIFTRFGGSEDDEKFDNNCTALFQNKSPNGTTCTLTEIINNKNITVVYKQIGDKIGRRVVNQNGSRRKRRQANFEEWNPGLYVDDVIHKVDMDITETGTEAAAATLVLATRHGRRPTFAANEPFFFVIRDEDTKIILFTSVVYKPVPNYDVN